MGLNYIDYLDVNPSIKTGLGRKREMYEKVSVEQHPFVAGQQELSRSKGCNGTAPGSQVHWKILGGEEREEIHPGDPFSSGHSKATL